MAVVRVKFRRGTDTEWSAKNPVLYEGEVGAVTNGINKGKFKVGDGVTAWNDLEFAVGSVGPQGPKGDTGAAGPQGLKGDKGDTGATGPVDPIAAQNAADALNAANTAYSLAYSASASASAALSTANNAYSTASSANALSTSAFASASAAIVKSDAAIASAATAISSATAAFTKSDSAIASATSAVTLANTAIASANAAFSQSNTAISSAQTAVASANAAFIQSNNAVASAASAVTTANAAFASAAAAIAAANSASATANAALSSANGKNVNYYQSTTPTGTLVSGDLWFDTGNDNRISRWSGSDWTLVGLGNLAVSNVDAGKITTGYLNAARIQVGTLDANVLKAGTIVSSNIGAGTILSSNIAANTIVSSNLAANTILASNIAANTITGSQIAAETIVSANIKSGTIIADDIAANTITASQIAIGTIVASNIAANTITGTQIAIGTILATNIAANTITSSQIAIGTIVASNIASGAIIGDLISATAIDGKTIIGATIITKDSTTARTVLNSDGFFVYNTNGAGTLSIISSTGSVVATGGTFIGNNIIGANISTNTGAGARVVMDTTGLYAYKTDGNPSFSLRASDGSIIATGGSWYAGSIGGATIYTNSGASATTKAAVVMSTTGLYAYDSTGTATFTLTASTGNLQVIGGSITGSTIKTAFSGRRVQLQASDNSISFVNSSNSVIGQMLAADDSSLLIHHGSSPAPGKDIYPWISLADQSISMAGGPPSGADAAPSILASISGLNISGRTRPIDIYTAATDSSINLTIGGSSDAGRLYLQSGGGVFVNDFNNVSAYVQRKNYGSCDPTVSGAPLQIGFPGSGFTGVHLKIGQDTIQAANNSSTADAIYINKFGGQVRLGESSGSSTSNNAVYAPPVLGYQPVNTYPTVTVVDFPGNSNHFRLGSRTSTQNKKDRISPLGEVQLSTEVLLEKIVDYKEFNYKKVLDISPVTFHAIDPEEDTERVNVGFIAEDVAEKAPQLALYKADGSPTYYDINGIVAALLAVVQEQQKRIKDLEDKVGNL